MHGKLILVVDDDHSLCQMIKTIFTRAGARVVTAYDGEEGLRQVFKHRPDLVLLDIRMPQMDGWELCREIRRVSQVPIIMLTTMHRDDDVVRGLEVGADDYVTKPFDGRVLLARASAALRRAELPSVTEQPVGYSDEYLTIDVERHRVYVDGKSVPLSAREFRLLALLAENAGRVLPYERMLERVWGWEYRDHVDYLHVYLSHLRRKVEKDPKNPEYLHTEYGVGYRFERHAQPG